MASTVMFSGAQLLLFATATSTTILQPSRIPPGGHSWIRRPSVQARPLILSIRPPTRLSAAPGHSFWRRHSERTRSSALPPIPHREHAHSAASTVGLPSSQGRVYWQAFTTDLPVYAETDWVKP